MGRARYASCLQVIRAKLSANLIRLSSEVVYMLPKKVVPTVVRMDASCHENYHIES